MIFRDFGCEKKNQIACFAGWASVGEPDPLESNKV